MPQFGAAILLAIVGAFLFAMARFNPSESQSPTQPTQHAAVAPGPTAKDWNAVFLDHVAKWARRNPEAFCAEYFSLIRANNPQIKFESQQHFDYAWHRVCSDIEPALREYLFALDWIRQHQPKMWAQLMVTHPR